MKKHTLYCLLCCAAFLGIISTFSSAPEQIYTFFDAPGFIMFSIVFGWTFGVIAAGTIMPDIE